MKNFYLSIIILVCCANFLTAQDKIFSTYHDTIALKADTESLVKTFIKDVKKLQPDISFDIT